MRIALRDIHKYYGNVHANNGISMEIAQGTVHGVLGENGAGKSTLMRILAGYSPRSGGEILLDGRPVSYQRPAEATRYGIGMLYQDPLDFPPLSVLENFMIGQTERALRREHSARRRLETLAGDLGFALPPEAPVSRLTVGERQQLELVRLLALGVEVLILDEPTTGISSTQKEALFGALKRVVSEGKTILLVSHKLEDVQALCDEVTVLRQGSVSGHMVRPFETDTLLGWMFGDVPRPAPCATAAPGPRVLDMQGVSSSGGRAGLQACTTCVREGEVVGLAGLEGSGQGVFLRLAAGLRRPLEGTIRVGDTEMTGRDYHAFREAGVTFLPSARLEEGLITGLSVAEHVALQAASRFKVPWKWAEQEARRRIGRYRIVGQPQTPVEALSGGNQQRLLLALMPPAPRLLLLENPTRGLDLESARWVWEELMAYAARGTGIVFSAAELEEIFEVAHRVLVFFEGRVIKDVATCETTPDEIGRAVAGKT